MHGTFVELVEDDRGHPRQVWISLYPSRQNAFGDHFNPCAVTHASVISRAPAHRVAHLLPEQLGHSTSDCPSCDSPRFEHKNRLCPPWLVE